VFVALGAAPVLGLVLWTAALAPAGFIFGTLTFPAQAPADFYIDRPWKLSGAAKVVDLAKFLALGPALLAMVAVFQRRSPGMLSLLALAGLLAALLPTPTWRQYLLPLLPPLFVLLAWGWHRRPPGPVTRVAAAVFAVAGLAPTAAALATGDEGMPTAMHEMRAVRAAMDGAGTKGPVATLSPQFLPFTGRLPDTRFATGPFLFRSRQLEALPSEAALHLISRRRLSDVPLPGTILTGGEGRWTAGDDRLDAVLAAEAARRGYRETRVGRWRVFTR
jgi:hypothetical protein